MMSDHAKAVRAARKAEGLCFRCGRIPLPGERQCEWCSDLHKARQARYRAKRRSR